MARVFSACPTHAIGIFDTGSLTTLALDSALSLGVSGDCIIFGLIAPVAQASGNLTVYAYVNAVTGSPTDVRCAIYATSGSDPDRYTGAAIATSGAVDCSSAAATWVMFSLTGVSLTAGEHYWIVIDNRTASPGSNYPEIAIRGACDVDPASGSKTYYLLQSGSSINGFSADANMSAYMGPCVVKFAGGELLGNPYVASSSHASNANDRGIRVAFAENRTISAVWCSQGVGTATAVKIYSGASLVATATLSYHALTRSNIGVFGPVTLAKDTDYDIVAVYSGASTQGTIFYMGQASPPADVLACRPVVGATSWAYVDGATPGSYTVDNNSIMAMWLLEDDAPAVAGGNVIVVED